MELSWTGIHARAGDTHILRGITGRAKKGQLVALMGSSGAGKTTLLNVIGNRNLKGLNVSGAVHYGRNAIDPKTWRFLCGFVSQDDIFHQNLTARETILFSSHLTLPKDVSLHEKKARIDRIAGDLGITHVLDKRIKFLSGGEKKRVSIGTQLITNPRVLMLDEPTSGLDSYTALNVVSLLKRLANDRHLIVIVTIHMPRETIVNLFDKVITLARGQVLFDGPVDSALDHFSHLGHPIPKHTNPADFLLDTANSQDVDRLLEAWNGPTEHEEDVFPSEDGMRLDQVVIPAHTSMTDSIPRTMDVQVESLRPSWSLQSMVLFKRNLLNLWRDRPVIITTAAQTVVITVLVGIVFLQLGNSQPDVQSRYGVLFFLALHLTFSNLVSLSTSFPLEKKLIVREYQSGGYAPWVAFVARFFAQWSVSLLATTFVVTVVFFMVNLNSFWLYFVTLHLVVICAIALGLTIGAGAASPQMAQALSPTIAILLILVSGLYANRDTLPAFVAWLEWVSFVAYAYQILMVNEFTGQTFTCTSGVESCFRRGEDVIQFFTLDSPPIWVSFLGMLGFFVAVMCLGIGLLSWSVKHR